MSKITWYSNSCILHIISRKLHIVIEAVSLLWKKDNEQVHCDRKGPKHLFNIYYLRADLSDLFVASGEGPKFFQNLHQSINVLLRIYGLIKYFLINVHFPHICIYAFPKLVLLLKNSKS
ncbi:hypothetical protein Avbf_14983 [Armadillidium vulgare]|nr:hypothetical protein Avbf_14983 [Armadillidium vulgare]